jgi:hypothetical protein
MDVAGVSKPARAGGGGGYDLSGIAVLAPTGNDQLDTAQRIALAVLAQNFDGVTHAASADYYSNPWIRDSFAWGMIPSRRDPNLAAYSSSELSYWLAKQQPFGGWLTAPLSGYFDETAILIGAVLDAYQVTGDLNQVRRTLPRLERGWRWLARSYIRPSHGSGVLLYANVPPHVAADWVDEVARTGYATQLEALWYNATRSMSIMEGMIRHDGKATYYHAFADRIRRDINRLLWTTAAPYSYGAPKVGPVGHYRSWLGPRDYFELDSNFLCILYGIADPAQAAGIVGFVQRHQSFLLGLDSATGLPAKVLYGEYAPADYARKRNRIGRGIYQNAYWPSVGALVAMGFARAGHVAEGRTILMRIGQTIVAQGDIREWYAEDGVGKGAPHFQWAARMFLIALCRLYPHPPSAIDSQA